MNCPKCGNEIDNNSEFCPLCGEDLSIKQEKHPEEPLNNKDNITVTEIRHEFSPIILAISFFVLLLLIVLSLLSSNVDFIYLILIIVVPILLLIMCISLCKHIKNIVINVGRALLDFTTSLDVVMAVVIIVVGFFVCQDEYNSINNGIWWYILGSVAYLLIMLLKDYTLYLLVDIRDSLKKIADKK